MIDLNRFCQKDSTKIVKPWSRDGYTYATNGHILVRVPLISEIADNPEAPKIEGVESLPMDHERMTDWVKLPDIIKQLADAFDCELCDGKKHLRICPECNGYGEVELHNDYSTYECPCHSCDGQGYSPSLKGEECYNCYGTGKQIAHRLIRFDCPDGSGRGIDLKYLYLLSSLPNPRISPTGKPMEAMRFKFDGGVGLVMPMHV